MSPIDPRLEEAVLAYLFGDTGDDPGRLVTEGARIPGFADWLAALDGELAALGRAIDGPPGGLARARLAALREEVARWAARPGADDIDGVRVAAAGGDVRSLAASRARRRRAPWLAIGALAAAVILTVALVGRDATPPPREPPRITVAQAKAWAEEITPEGLGFAGAAAPSARDRGFLVGLVRDLSAPPPDADALDAARVLAQRAAAGLDLPGSPDEIRARVAAGCEAFLTGAEDRAACAEGLAAYQRKRDAALSSPR